MGRIADNYRRVRESIPEHVQLVVAVKGHAPEEVGEVIEAGARIIGENYVQEAEAAIAALGAKARSAQWHLIGHLQRNKAARALALFDVIQSVDSMKLAAALAARGQRPLPVYVEVNVAGEQSKSGVRPQQVKALLEEMSGLQGLRVEGLMTMEPYLEDAELARPYFRRMKELFEALREEKYPNVDLKVLSMGMSNAYEVAIEEGSNMVRIGTAIMGPRQT